MYIIIVFESNLKNGNIFESNLNKKMAFELKSIKQCICI